MQGNRCATVRRILSAPGETRLALRMLMWRLILPLLKRSLSLSQLTSLMRCIPRARPQELPSAERILELSRLVCRVGRGPSHNCLTRSLIAYRYLSLAGAKPKLSIGIGRRNGLIDGHAWITVDGQALGEVAGASLPFEEVACFGRG